MPTYRVVLHLGRWLAPRQAKQGILYICIITILRHSNIVSYFFHNCSLFIWDVGWDPPSQTRPVNTIYTMAILSCISYHDIITIIPLLIMLRFVVHLAGWHPAKPNEACDCETNNKHQLLLYHANTISAHTVPYTVPYTVHYTKPYHIYNKHQHTLYYRYYLILHHSTIALKGTVWKSAPTIPCQNKGNSLISGTSNHNVPIYTRNMDQQFIDEQCYRSMYGIPISTRNRDQQLIKE